MQYARYSGLAINEVGFLPIDPYRYLEYALENVGKKPIKAIFPYSKDLEIR